MSPAQYVSVSLATCVGLCRFGEAWAALRAENLLTYLRPNVPEVFPKSLTLFSVHPSLVLLLLLTLFWG